MKNKLNKNMIWFTIFICFLIALDQLSKIIVSLYFLDIDTYLIPKLLGFRPVLNTDNLSFLNRVLHLNIPLYVLIIVNVIIIGIICMLYKKWENKETKTKIFNIAFIFLFAGIICSLIDKIFYKGSLDFIIFYKWIIDFKDIYLTIAEILIPIMIIKNIIIECKMEIATSENTINS